MLNILVFLKNESIKTLKNPGRLLNLKSKNARELALGRLKGVRDQFEDAAQYDKQIRRRQYASYEAYKLHQASKLKILTSGDRFGHDGTDLIAYDVSFRSVLRKRLGSLDIVLSGKSCVCLAARLGTEVKAFADHGAFAVGIDLNPGPNNEYVLPGDFHNLIFPDNSVDVIYCNSVDHAFDLGRLAAEIYRVIKPNGCVLLEIPLGSAESSRANTGKWEALEWDRSEDVIQCFAGDRFNVEELKEFIEPWPGKTFALKRLS